MVALSWQAGFTLALTLTVISLASARPQQEQVPHALLDIETPNQFSYSSPLQSPESLRSKPYFDFLSTLYAHDTAKSNLFRSPPRPRREAEDEVQARPRRAIVFRPLFVYKQREVRKQEIKEARRRNGEANRRVSGSGYIRY